jgi:hypothetical protein
MGTKLALALAATALLVAVVGSTSAGRAALDAVVPVPLAKRAYLADTARNAIRVGNIKASRTPTPGMLLPLDATGKLPASIGAVGPKGDKGDRGKKGKDGTDGKDGAAAAFTATSGYPYVAITAGTTKTVQTLPLQPGRYVILGSVVVEGKEPTFTAICTLAAGTDKDTVSAIGYGGASGTNFVGSTVTATVIHEFKTADSASLACLVPSTRAASYANARITAIQLNSSQ